VSVRPADSAAANGSGSSQPGASPGRVQGRTPPMASRPRGCRSRRRRRAIEPIVGCARCLPPGRPGPGARAASGKAAARRGRLDAIQRPRKSRVILLIHRQETVSFLGVPLARYNDIEDSEANLRAIRLTPTEMPLDLIAPSRLRKNAHSGWIWLFRVGGRPDTVLTSVSEVV